MGEVLNKTFCGGYQKNHRCSSVVYKKSFFSLVKEKLTLILKQMSLFWHLALALQTKTEARGLLTTSWKSAEAENLIIDHVLKFSYVYRFCSFFYISYHVN